MGEVRIGQIKSRARRVCTSGSVGIDALRDSLKMGAVVKVPTSGVPDSRSAGAIRSERARRRVGSIRVAKSEEGATLAVGHDQTVESGSEGSPKPSHPTLCYDDVRPHESE